MHKTFRLIVNKEGCNVRLVETVILFVSTGLSTNAKDGKDSANLNQILWVLTKCFPIRVAFC